MSKKNEITHTYVKFFMNNILEIHLNFMVANLKKKNLTEVGFEPTHLTILELKSNALDRSAIPPYSSSKIVF